MKVLDTPTVELSSTNSGIFDYFNKKLFDGTLPEPIILVVRNKKTIGGYFVPNKWMASEDEEVVLHEIGVNANVISELGIADSIMVQVHEMLHLWQWEYGKPSPDGYHNKEFAEKSKSIGLTTEELDTAGNKTGRDVGRNITAEIIMGGAFEKALSEIPDEIVLPWISLPVEVDPTSPGGGGNGKSTESDKNPDHPNKQNWPKHGGKRNRNKTTYSCPVCGSKIWGKPGLNIKCGDCHETFLETA